MLSLLMFKVIITLALCFHLMGKAQQVWDIHKMKVKLSYCLVIGWALLCICPLHLGALSYAKCMLPSLLLLRP